MLKNYLLVSFRAFRKAPVYSLLNITGLALGIACTTLILLWVEDELSFDRQYPKHNELYSIRMNLDYGGRIESHASVPGPMPDAIRNNIPGIVNQSRVSYGRELFAVGDKSLYDYGRYVDTGFFSMMQLTFVKGNAAGFNNPHALVISEEMAEKFFGDADPIGKTIRVDQKNDFTVIGVVKNSPPNVSIPFNWLAPVSNFLEKNQWLNSWGTYGIITLVELQPGTDVEKVDQQLTAILQPKDRLYSKAEVRLWSMNDWHLRDNFINGEPDGGGIRYVRLFSAIAWIILIIACINFMNLATARAGQRAREIGVRKTIGAVRLTLIGQFLTEAIIMAIMAVVLSVLLVYIFLPAFNFLIDKRLTFDLFLPMHVAALLAIGIFCGLLAGSYPAFYLSSFDPVAVLKGQRTGLAGGAGFIRKGLVVTQFAISVILIICTVIIYQQVQHIKDRDLGYNKQNLLWTNLSGNLEEHFSSIRDELLQSGAVEDAALSNSPPLQMWSTLNSTEITWQGNDGTGKSKIYWEGVSPEYFSTMGLQLKEGRDFYSHRGADSGKAIINETLAEMMGEAGRIGTVLTYRDRYRFQVVGIVKDYLFNDMHGTVAPLMISCHPHENFNVLNIRLKKDGDFLEKRAKVEEIMKARNPGYPFDYQVADVAFNELFYMETRIGQFAGVFAGLAIFISCLGLFGLAAFTAERRTKEIGIRKVLGASTSGLTALLTKEFIRLVIISCLIAFPLAWMIMNSWLNDYAYRTIIHWWVFLITGTGALGIALFTVSFQAIRAALLNPVKTLRSE